MNDCDFYQAVSVTEFAERYYALCERFPVRDIPLCRCDEGDVMQVLSEMGRVGNMDPRDRFYSFDRVLERGTVHIGFAIQTLALVEFWFWLEAREDRIGSNYAVIAQEAAKLAHEPVPDPPYPRPEFHSLDELRFILGECFDLADTLFRTLCGNRPTVDNREREQPDVA